MARCEQEFGSSPSEEPCAQVGDEGYALLARKECTLFAMQIRRTYEEAHRQSLEDVGVRLKVKSNAHDFGSYYEVVAVFNDSDESALNAIYWLDDNVPEKWDETSLKLLKEESAS